MVRFFKLWGFALLFIAILAAFNCSNSENSKVLSGEYFGQTPPDTIPTLFAPGIISDGMNNRDMTYSPAGDEFFYSLWLPKRSGVIMYVRRINEIWGTPEIAPFSGKYSDIEPCFSPDGREAYFVSNRPVDPEGDAKDYNIWYAKKNELGWEKPQVLNKPVNSDVDEFYPSLADNGNLYFTANHQGTEDIYVSRLINGQYAEPERLPDAINSDRGEFNGMIAPDESYLIFSSYGRKDDIGGGDLYVSFHNEDGSWTKAVNMGEPINSKRLDYCPGLSSDGKYFFFTSSRLSPDLASGTFGSFHDIIQMSQSPQNGYDDVYWVDAGIIMKYREQ